MYLLKHHPSDFIVREIPLSEPASEGDYSYFLMEKKNYNTLDAIERIAQSLHKPLSDFGWAGNKDRNAITYQRISIKNCPASVSSAHFDDISLTALGSHQKKLALGELLGNEFRITIRNLEDGEIKALSAFSSDTSIPNLFGPQRFGENNALIGKLLVSKNFKDAALKIIESDSKHGKMLSSFLEKNPTNHIGAIRLLSDQVLIFYIHAYQSLLFNQILTAYLDLGILVSPSLRLPLIGFGFEIEETTDLALKKIIKETLKNEEISPRDFIIPQLPKLSSEGEERDALFFAKDFRIVSIEEDECFDLKKKALVEFSLGKSCYATTVLSFLFKKV